ncbi:MAG: hypothetical protein E1N59_1677 [Puniceicoccaceae bacterium 5H]|nr:MAG: hypothetical protein E1N59_1677 [Puniceicoccaceae bacterium 5H]
MMESSSPSPWRWIVWLSLDAPLVALFWTFAWGRQLTGAAFHPPAVLVGLAIWLGYVADRLLDVKRYDGEGPESARHAFYQRHERTWWRIWIAGVGLEFVLALCWLDGAMWLRGVLLALLAAAYALSLSWWQGWTRLYYKRVAVALLFAAGVVVFLPWQIETLHAWLCMALLALINLVQVTSWQAQSRRLVWFGVQFVLATGVMQLAMLDWTPHLRVGLLVAALSMMLLQLWKPPETEMDRLLPDACLMLGGLIAWLG